MKRISVFFIPFIIGLSCFSQKKIIKQAKFYETSGIYDKASVKYMEALHKNATRPESVEGLKRTSQKVVDQKLTEYSINRNSSELRKAIRVFDELISYNKRLEYFDVRPHIPNYYFENYRSDKEHVVVNLKEQFINSTENGNSVKTQKLINEIKKLDPQFDEDELNQIAAEVKAERTYQKAIEDFNNEKWVESWNTFLEVERLVGNHKATRNYKSKIREKGTNLAVLISSDNRFSHAQLFRDNIIAEVISQNNPLIRIIDRDNLEEIIAEQKLGLSGILDEKSTAALGRILGVKIMLLIKVLTYDEISGPVEITEHTAYLASGDSFQPESYKEIRNVNRLLTSIQYQLISTETAEILFARVVKKEVDHTVIYSEYDGDENRLYPAVDGYVYKTGPIRDDFLGFFKASRNPPPLKQQVSDLLTIMVKEIASSLNAYFK